MKKLICILLAVFSVAVFASCSDSSGSSTPDTAKTADETVNVGEAEDDVFEIETDYCNLKYPNKWKDKVEITVDDNDVNFKHIESDTVLFDIVFNGESGASLGTIEINGETIDVKYDYREFDENSDYYMECCEMQEDVNVIIHYLYTEYGLNI